VPVALVALVLLAAACSPSPSPTATATGTPPAVTPAPSQLASSGGPPASIDASAYSAIAQAVERIRGLTPKADVTPVLIDEATLRTNLMADYDQTNPPALVRQTEQLLSMIGLLPPGTSLRQATIDLQSGQVLGYYSPERDQLFVVSRGGTVGALERVTYSHEFTHQLQDQNFDLATLKLDATDQSDRSLARLALVEGDAVSSQATWMQTNLTAAEIGEVLAASSDPAALAALQNAPAILRATSLFPYSEGYAFAASLIAQGGYDAVNRAFKDPPASTEQVIHPEKYAAHEAPIPVAVAPTLPAKLGPGWAVTSSDTLGELLLRTWLVEGKVESGAAARAAAGWGGDRVELLTGPAGVAVAILTAWDTAKDADEFEAVAPGALTGLAVGGLVRRVDPTHISIAFGPDPSRWVAAIGG